jgi:hypothetical protein
VKNWVLKTEVNDISREGKNARLPAMIAMLILGPFGTIHQTKERFSMVKCPDARRIAYDV